VHFLLSHWTKTIRKRLRVCEAVSRLLDEDANSFGKGNEFSQGSNLHFLHYFLAMDLMVRSVQPSARAACLFCLPRMTRSKTCRSRGVNVAIRARTPPTLFCSSREI
jgi:hypothetical protein